MANFDFLQNFPPGNASLMIITPDGIASTIYNLHTAIIGQRCPLLELSFEIGANDIPKAIIEANSQEIVVCFLRFLYQGNYLDYDVPCSLLVHAELCRMADHFEVPELQVSAHANIIRETELSCSQPTPPIDLCLAIRFIYAHLSDQKPLIDTILNYCVFCFLYHGLGTNKEFRQTAFELQPFHRDLCRTSFKRGFEDDGAIDIVRLPVCRPNPHPDAEMDKIALGDFLFELWCDDPHSDVNVEARERKRRKVPPESGYTFVHRPKETRRDSPMGGGESSSDEAQGFTLVHRPKIEPNLSEDDHPSDASSEAELDSGDQSDVEPLLQFQKERLDDSFLTVKPTVGGIEENQQDGPTKEGGSTTVGEPSTQPPAATSSEKIQQRNFHQKDGYDLLDDQDPSDSEWSVVFHP